ncbi:MaoC family dehydratase [Vibrio sp. SS-MA-C1-2]|uniref:MaoC family dehydratase n=1 Tax=Vibrio sp. SS-MA-C1-2 TaxID=2908646 RepID=UPI001F24D8DD|nr:MaoC family dehydratase [Vibrio sp. SS-MA-C1-2]UJF17680.1 MaoC family dehydratase [Vibrio sp. SS-MA-C1-2]
MKVVKYIRRKGSELAQKKTPFEFNELKDWLSPTLRDYWVDFLTKAHHSQLAHWVQENHKLVTNHEKQTHPEQEESEKVTEKPKTVTVDPKAEAVYLELVELIGEEIHVGDWMVVTQDKINSFADVTEDQQWIHNDPERAALESPFKTTIAHGFLTLSLLPVLTESVDPKNPQYPTAKMTVNYGLNQVRFPYPIKVDNRIRARSKLTGVTPIRRGLELTKEIFIEIEGVRRPGCVTESVVRLYF